jgi:hypothetical protein
MNQDNICSADGIKPFAWISRKSIVWKEMTLHMRRKDSGFEGRADTGTQPNKN